MTKVLKYAPLGNPKRDYKQDKFIISTFKINGRSSVDLSYEAVERIIKNLKEAHFNQIELGWTHPDTIPKAVKVCNEEGLDLIVQNLEMFGSFQDRPGAENTEDVVKDVIELYGSEPCVKGYYIWDEPGQDKDIAEAAKLTNWFYRYAPGKLNFACYLPSYNDRYNWINNLYPSYVKKYLDEIEPPVVSFDHYPYGISPVTDDTSDQLDKAHVWKDLSVAREEALKRNSPFWFYWMTMRVSKCYPKLLEKEQLRLQIFYALLYGAKALQAYGTSGSGSGPDGYNETRTMMTLDGEKAYFYDSVKEDLGEAKMLGKTFMALTSEHVYHDKKLLENDEYFDTHFREDVKKSEILDMEELPKRCSIGEFSDGYGNKYVYILNRDYKVENEFYIKLKGEKRIYEVSGKDSLQYVLYDKTESFNVKLAPASAVLLRVDDAKNPVEDIVYICE